MLSVFFENIESKIIDQINGATSSIKVVAAWFTSPSIIKALIDKTRANIRVEVIISWSETNFEEWILLDSLIKHGAHLFIGLKTAPFIHHKFIIIDNNIIINGSYNFTLAAKTKFENVMIFKLDKTHPVLIKFYHCFEELRNNYSKGISQRLGEPIFGHFYVSSENYQSY